jgi:DNA-binding winged helix-turn-helix (wHTH) protein
MEDGIYRFGEFTLSPSERQLAQSGKSVPLPPRAFDALHLLVRRHESLVSRGELFSTLWPGVHVTDASLTNLIVLLRKIVGPGAIETVSKFGYRFTPSVTGEPGIRQDAYTAFVRGKELLAERSPDSILRAQDLFWLCLARDPHFAPGWAWLGRARRLQEKFGRPSGAPALAEAAFERAFAIDPELACAHQFYTQVQVDSGHAAQAMTRLALRIKTHGMEPETLAGLVQVLRYCGLLDDSLRAHRNAIALDPAIKTSVAHTHFLQGDFAKVFETYTGVLYYLDAAAWAALGAHDGAAALLRPRLSSPGLSPVMSVVMGSLLAILEGRSEQALDLIRNAEPFREPEILFYLARHLGMLDARDLTIRFLQRAREEGFWSSTAMENDPAFAQLRNSHEFDLELEETKRLESVALQAFYESLGSAVAWGSA